MSVPLQQLAYFVAVADRGTLTGAAVDLHVAQPSLSTQLRRLERRLGVDLFERLPRGVRLTQAGAALLPIARQTLADVDQIVRSARALNDPGGGTLRVGATPSLSRVLLPTALAQFHATYPGVRLEIAETGSEDLAGRLERDELDVALLVLPVPQRAVRTRVLAEEDVVLAVGPGHRLRRRRRIGMDEVARVPLVLPRSGYTIRTAVISACRRAGAEPTVVCDGGELAGVIAQVERGLGATVLPASVAAVHPDLHAIRIDDPRLLRTIALARRAGAVGPPATDAFAKTLLNVLHDAQWTGMRPADAR
jgi:DNA-binding transcriptional LysR family regulator